MFARFIVSLVLVLLAAGTAQARKVALVIGNSAYRNVLPLANPVSDARAMSVKLEELGFEVVTGLDQDYDAMQATVSRFARDAIGADIALLYYAGHGLQVRGENFLIPVDASFRDEAALDFEAIPVDFMIRQMSRNVRLRMIFLDACRDNPLAKTLAASMEPSRSVTVSSGLAEIKIDDPGEGAVIAFATSPGDVAYDGKREHSPFTEALLEHIDAPNLPLQNVLTLVTRDVYEATNKRQRPWFNASVIGEIYLNGSDVRTASAAPAARTAGDGAGLPQPMLAISDAAPRPGEDPVAWDQEKTLFEFAQKSGTAEDFEAYLSAYPSGHFADIAKNFIMRNTSAMPQEERKVAILGKEGLSERTLFTDGERSASEPAAVVASPPETKPVETGTDLTEAVLRWDKQRRREVQARLELDGIELGSPDGDFGPKTREAIAAWQAGREVPATGYFSQSQYDLLVARTVQSYAVWEMDDRSRRAAPQAARPQKTRSAIRGSAPQRARPAQARKQRQNKSNRGVLVGRRQSGGGDVAGAAFVGGLIGGAIGGALGR